MPRQEEFLGLPKGQTFEQRHEEAERRANVTMITLVIGFAAAATMYFIFAKNITSDVAFDRALATYAGVLGTLTLIGLVFIDAIDGTPLFSYRILPLTSDRIGTLLKNIIILLAAAGIAQAVLTFLFTWAIIPVKSAISDLEMFLYYIFAGVAEELFFRGVVLNIFALVDPWLGIFGSSLLFAWAHQAVYGGTYLIFVMFVLGIIWGYGYLKFKDITANQLSHLLMNMLVVGRVMVY